jgi:hypothetical protein
MKSFLRENLMIVVSISLPLIIVVLFALASVLPHLYAAPPAYDLLIMHQGRVLATEFPVRIELAVQDERLSATVVKAKRSAYGNNPRIYRYDHESGQIREIDIPIPDKIGELPEGTEIPVPELAGLRLSNSLGAPDGYEFRGYRRGGGLMTELFGGSRYRHDVAIAKDGAVVRLNIPNSDEWYGGARFLAWVIN